MFPREHTSASQLSTYARCPRQYELRYLLDAPSEFTSVSLVVGSVFHAAVSYWFEQKLVGKRPGTEEINTIVAADFAAATTDTTVRWGKWTPGDLQEHTRRLVWAGLSRFGELPVSQTDVRFTMELHDHETGEVLPRHLLGYFDLVLDDGTVIELKTARAEYKPMDVATSIQFGAYLMAVEELKLSKGLDLIVAVKNKTPRFQQLRISPSARSERRFLATATAIERAIEAGHFPPSPGWTCGGCEFQRRCLGAIEEDVQAHAA